MSYEKFRLTDDAISTNGVEAAPDKLTGTTQENKKVFDRLIRAVVKDIINGLALQIGTDVARFDSGEGKISAETAATLELDEGATLNDALVRLKNMAASGGIPTAEFVAVSKATAEAYGLEGDVNVDMVLQVIVDAITEAATKSYTKEETLSPTTKTALGLSEDAVPDDVFASLGWHTWAARALEIYMSASGIKATTKYQSSESTDTFYYGDEITINSAGKISIVNPASVTYQYDASGSVVCAELSNKYFATSADNLAVVYKGGDTVYKNNTASGGYITYISSVDEYSVRYGTKHYVSSANRNAYPDNGIVDNVEYEYLGAPLDNAKEAYGMRLHWWKRRTEEIGYETTKTRTSKIVAQSNSTTNWYVADSVAIDELAITLSNAQLTPIRESDFDSVLNSLRNKYISKSIDGTQPVYYVDELTTYSSTNKNGVLYCSYDNLEQWEMDYYETIGEYEYVSSPDRNAYPDSGVEGIFSYQYLAVPFENAREGAKIVTGSYAGTGTYGQSNPNSLTFDFAPKMVFMTHKVTNSSGSIENLFGDTRYMTSNQYYLVMTPCALTTSYRAFSGFKCNNSTGGSNMGKRSEDGKTIYWYDYGSGATAATQMNDSTLTYHYLAIG